MSSVPVFCGIDWAENHCDVAVVDDARVVLARRRIAGDSPGYQQLLAFVAEHATTGQLDPGWDLLLAGAN